MRRRLSLTAALVLLLSLLCACAAQHAQEMDENGYELYFLSDPNSAGGGDAIRTQEKRLTLDGAMETEDCVRALMEALLAGPDEPSLSSPPGGNGAQVAQGVGPPRADRLERTVCAPDGHRPVAR